MKPCIDSINLQELLQESKYWLRRDIATLDEECAWLKKEILNESNNKNKYQIHLSSRLTELNILRSSFGTSLSKNIASINEELKHYYYNDGQIILTDLELNLDKLSPRQRFLFEKKIFLESVETAINENHARVWPGPHATLEVQTGEKRNRLRVVFDIGKKFIDILDDAWSVMKGALPAKIFTLVGPFLTGGVGFIINLTEALLGINQAYRAWIAYKNKNNTVRQKKTRMLTGVLTFLFGSVGAGLSVTFIVGAIGAAVSGMTLMPVLIPIFLLSIYTTALFKRAYIFHQAKVDEAKTKKEFIDKLSEIKVSDKHAEMIDQEFSKLHADVECAKHFYEYAREERLKAERNIAFNVIEVVATSIVLIGTILGLSALGAASVASFGVVPLTILVLGVAIGLFCKAFETIDEKRDFTYTRQTRTWMIETFHKLFPRKGQTLNKHNENRNSTAEIFMTVYQGDLPTTDTTPITPGESLPPSLSTSLDPESKKMIGNSIREGVDSYLSTPYRTPSPGLRSSQG